MINIYTDGACSNNGYPNACAGYGIYFGENNINNEYGKVIGKQSNNTAEITAFIKSLEIIDKFDEPENSYGIYTDSEYVIKCATSYGEKLSNNNWKSSKGKDPPNKELVKKAYELFKNRLNVKLYHIEAHTNKEDIHSIGNREADKLANKAIGVEECPYNANNIKINHPSDTNKIYLNISFNDKDKAKSLGAKWDMHEKKWYYNKQFTSDDNIEELNKLSENTVNIDKTTTKVIDTGIKDSDKIYIKVSFANKEIAKKNGARWDASIKSWYYLSSLSEDKIKNLEKISN